MRWFGRSGISEGANTDLQSRLSYIEFRAEELKKKSPEDSEVGELAYLVQYLAGILKKHLNTDER
jgi:hypothetical protein